MFSNERHTTRSISDHSMTGVSPSPVRQNAELLGELSLEEMTKKISYDPEKFLEQSTIKFEEMCLDAIKDEQWNYLAKICQAQIDHAKSDICKGSFYLGIAMYKMGKYCAAINSFNKAAEIMTTTFIDHSGSEKFTGQIYYNLGLVYFRGYYTQNEHSEECFRRCLMNDPKHPYGYKNLAFIKNLAGKYEECIAVCNMAKDFLPKTHDCHSHWAFALMKR